MHVCIKCPTHLGLFCGGPSDLPAEGSGVSCCGNGYHCASFSFTLKLSASHLDRPPWPTSAALGFDPSSLVSLVSKVSICSQCPATFAYCAIMTMTPTANKIDEYVPTISCFSSDDAADVVTPPVSAAASAPDELTPGVELAALLASGFVLTGLVAKPGDGLVLHSAGLTTGSGSKKET